jgi:HlyD family secretion protein
MLLIVLAGAGALTWYGWTLIQPEALPEGFASGNGRIEAVEIDIATRTPGRLTSVLVDEGDLVTAGQVLAEMDTEVLQAQYKQGEAELQRALTAVDAARSTVLQRESEKAAAQFVVSQRQAELDLAHKEFSRAENLLKKGVTTEEAFDTERARLFGAEAGASKSKADVESANAAIATAQSQVITCEAAVNAVKAQLERLQADINDSTLKASRDGRVQFVIAQPGEVLGAGGKVLNMVDLTDVYMTFFLPTAAAGRVKMGAEIHLVLDAAPDLVIPAEASFVADVAQFTPKTVETADERQKLMFRVKARIDQDLLKKHIQTVKTGLPGVAYVRLDNQLPWPARLEVRLPQ